MRVCIYLALCVFSINVHAVSVYIFDRTYTETPNQNIQVNLQGHGSEIRAIVLATTPVVVHQRITNNFAELIPQVRAVNAAKQERAVAVMPFTDRLAQRCPTVIQEAISEAVDNRGVIFVVAVGNDGTQTLKAPASCQDVVTVGAATVLNGVTSWSNYGEQVTVYANPTGVDRFQNLGTSFSAAYVAGIVARWLKDDETLTLEQIKHRLQVNSTKHKILDIGDPDDPKTCDNFFDAVWNMRTCRKLQLRQSKNKN